ncbi:MAG: hypothetical protein ACYC0I_05885 [Acidimicrobiales bacterium]
MKERASVFRYVGLEVSDDTLVGHYELDGRHFNESVTFEGVGGLTRPAVRAVAELWYLVAGLSYYKTGAPRQVELASTPVGEKGRALLNGALHDGLGEFAYRNELSLDDTVISGGADATRYAPMLDATRVLTPFGGGIDSVVTVHELNPDVQQALFIVSPTSGRFDPLEATAAVTGLSIIRARRTLDQQLLEENDFFNGHVPVTAMVSLLAAVAALADERGGVVMSNEHSSSSANLRWHGRDVNHQWSKSWLAERLIGDAISERVGDDFTVASFLRDRSELWVAQKFAALEQYHHVFRSCNRAFAQAGERRAPTWCGVCDKCLFINLVLSPFIARESLRDIFQCEPLANPALKDQLAALVGIGLDHKPFECVGDPGESAIALTMASASSQWSDVAHVRELALLASPDLEPSEMFEPQGPSRVPAHWLR